MTRIISGIIDFWARNSVAANLLMLLAFAGGAIGIATLEKESFPGGYGDGVAVDFVWPGASPKEVEEQIVVRFEEAVLDLDGLKRVTSVAMEGGGNVKLETRAEVDIDTFLAEVKTRIDSVNNLPADAYRPVTKKDRVSSPYFGIVLYGQIDLRELKRTAEIIRDEVARLPGGELAEVMGVLDEEVSIELSERTMRSYGIDFSTVARAVQASSLNASGGQVRADTGSVSLEARSLADSKEQFESIIVRQTKGGGIVTVGDVAQVNDRFEDRDLEARFHGKPAAFIFINPPETMDIVAFSRTLKEFVAERRKILPEALELTVLWSDNEFFGELMRIITNSAFAGILLVCLLLVLFLRPAIAFWVAVGIATAFAGGMALAPFLGVSINSLALFGCLLVTGVIVDDAIIIGENIHSEVERAGTGGVETVVKAGSRVSRPVIFGVITTMIAFAPWALLSGPERQFTKHLTLTVCAALTFSLIEAFCILPNHLSHMRPQRFDGRAGAFLRFQGRIANSLLWFADKVYRRILEAALRLRYATVAFFVSLLILAVGLVVNSHVRSQFFPEIEGNLMFVQIVLPDGTPFSRTQEIRERLEDSVNILIDETNRQYPELAESVVNGGSTVATGARIECWIGLSEPDKRPRNISTKILSTRLREIMGPVEDAKELNFVFTFDNDIDRLEFSLSHRDLDQLKLAAQDLRETLGRFPSTFGVGDDISAPGDEAQFTLRPGAAALGVTLQQVLAQVRQAYYGEEVQRLPRKGEDVRVMVRLPEQDRRSLDSLRELRIRTPDGRQIPLPELVEIEYVPGIQSIRRRDRLRSATVFANAPDELQSLIGKEVEDSHFPQLLSRYPGLKIEEIGGRQEQKEFLEEVTVLQASAFVIMYVLLAIAFGSYSQPFLIMTAIPFGFAGAVFGHLFMDVPLAMFSVFGIAAAAGVVINDNLVLVDQINFLRRQKDVGTIESLVEAAVGRFRPVFLTSLTTVIGITPILIDRSVQGQFLKPMVVSMAGAVTFALFVTLLLVPALYAVATEIRRGMAWILLGRPFEPLGSRFERWRGAV